MKKDMLIPDGFTCKDCSKFSFCKEYLGGYGDISENTNCDWSPSRFTISAKLVHGLIARVKHLEGLINDYASAPWEHREDIEDRLETEAEGIKERLRADLPDDHPRKRHSP